MTAPFTDADVQTLAGMLLGSERWEDSQALALDLLKAVAPAIANRATTQALLEAANAIQAEHPGEVKVSVEFLRARALMPREASK